MPTEPERRGSEAALLEQYLDIQRAAVLANTDGLDRGQMSQLHPPSKLTLSRLLYHLSLVEEDWMGVHFSGQPDRAPFVDADWKNDPDWQFRAPEVEPEQLRQRYRDACQRSRVVVREASGLEQSSAKPVRGEHFTLHGSSCI